MAISTPTLGVPSLRVALHEARRLGAEVVPVKRTGEVRVTWRDTRLLINARRKDATRELTVLLAQLRAAAPGRPRPLFQEVSMEAPAPPPRTRDNAKARTRGDQIREHIQAHTAPDVNGWRPYNSLAIANALGFTSTHVAGWTNYAEKTGLVQVRRRAGTGSRITHLRFAEEVPAATPTSPGPRMDQEREERPAPAAVTIAGGVAPIPVVPPATRPGTPSTPRLAEYAVARQAARHNRFVTVDPTDEQVAEILSDAVRLYWWIAKGGNPE